MRRGASAGGRGTFGSRLRPSDTNAALQARSPRERSGPQIHLLHEPRGRNAWLQTGRGLEADEEVHRATVGRRMAAAESGRRTENRQSGGQARGARQRAEDQHLRRRGHQNGPRQGAAREITRNEFSTTNASAVPVARSEFIEERKSSAKNSPALRFFRAHASNIRDNAFPDCCETAIGAYPYCLLFP